MTYDKDTRCPIEGCSVIGSEGGIKRHLKATHVVAWQEFPEVTDPRKKIKLDNPSHPPAQSCGNEELLSKVRHLIKNVKVPDKEGWGWVTEVANRFEAVVDAVNGHA